MLNSGFYLAADELRRSANKYNSMRAIICSFALVSPSILLISCTSSSAPSSTATASAPAYVGRPSYEERFDPWRASSRALEPAAKGERDAQDTLFLAAYVRVNQPYMGGEDLEQMNDNCQQLLTRLGDDAFSTALDRQRPEVRSAVKSFISTSTIQSAYPKTYALLRAAPKIDWPMDKAYRNG
jgi:hypothetical protein